MNILKNIIIFIFNPFKLSFNNILNINYDYLNKINNIKKIHIKNNNAECRFMYFDKNENYEHLLNVFWTKYIICQKNIHH